MITLDQVKEALTGPIMSIRPPFNQVSHRFWKVLQNGDIQAAISVINNVEIPLDNFMGTMPGGRDAAVHGLLEIYGIAGRWRRKPYYSLNDQEMNELKAKVKDMGLL